MAPREREHALLAVLFTDIVGSSDLAAQMGDESWKRLLRRHHKIMPTGDEPSAVSNYRRRVERGAGSRGQPARAERTASTRGRAIPLLSSTS